MQHPAPLAWLGTLALVCACGPGTGESTPPVASAGLASLRLTDQHGASWSPLDLQGGWTLLFFGFTRCPHACPLTLQQTAAARSLLEQSGVEPPRVVLVSVDPQNDTPAQLAAYLERFGDAYTGLTGAADAVAALERWLDAAHAPAARPDARTGAIDHTAYLYLIDPAGRLRARVQGVETAARIAETVRASMRSEASRTCHDKRSLA